MASSNEGEGETTVSADAARRYVRQCLVLQQVSDTALFWQQVALAGMPLAWPLDDERRQVLFVWRASGPLQGVYLSLNRVTDKDNRPLGMMTHIAGTDVWWLELALPATLRASYQIYEIPPDCPADHVARLGMRQPTLAAYSDPFNPAAPIGEGAQALSVLALDKAPPQPEWQTPQAHQGSLSTFHIALAGQQRQVAVLLPSLTSYEKLGMLVMTDAETWIDRLGVLGALEAAMQNERIAPMAVVGIYNLSIADRVAILGGQSRFVGEVAQTLIPWLRQRFSDQRWTGRERTALVGQSLGGITALMAAVHQPAVFGAVIAHSPSMWWRPDGQQRPLDFKPDSECWVSQEVIAANPAQVRIRLAMGTLEGAMVPHLERMHAGLIKAGVNSHLRLYTGGHDTAWWRGALMDDLAALFPG